MRLTLTVHALSGGGAEKVLAALAAAWFSAGHQVTVITLDDGAHDRWPLQPGIQRVALSLAQHSNSPFAAVRNNRIRIQRLRSAILESQPDRVVSFIDRMNVLTLLACRGLNLPVLISERTDPRRHSIGRLWNFLRRRTYPSCAGLVVQTQGVRAHCRPLVRGAPIYVIPNAAPAHPPRRNHSNVETSPLRAIAAGRLGPEKGFDRLATAFAAVAPDFPHWRLEIFGEGPERPALEQQIAQLGLAKQVSLRGWVSDLGPELSKADLFLLPSRYEGFPNALLEAMSAGVAAIAFDCDSGPAEIIRHAQNGWLVPADDVDGLTAALRTLMSDLSLRDRIGRQARDVAVRFSPDRIHALWDAALQFPSESEFDALKQDIMSAPA